MSKTYTVYILVANDGRRYIGMTSLPLSVRCIPSGYANCPSMGAAIRELGWNFFKKEVVAEGLSREKASVLEQEMIASYDTVDPAKGFNVAYGGVHFKHNESSRQKSLSRVHRETMDFGRKSISNKNHTSMA